jgi:hypothetical protein
MFRQILLTQRSMAGLKLSGELWENVAGFLSASDVSCMMGVCRHMRQCLTLNEFWELYARENLFGRACNYRIKDARRLFQVVVMSIMSEDVYNSVGWVLDVSSVDRDEEGPINTMQVSPCLEFLIDLNARVVGTVGTPTLRGHFSQSRCGCVGTGRPCYWSSAPSVLSSAVEHITYHLKSRLSFIVGFTVTPYQAFMHPNAPVYGPVEVCLQLVKNGHPDLQPPEYPNRYNRGRKTLAELSQGVYYQSEFYPVQNEFREQFFMFDRPVLCDSGVARLVYRGMHQRQLLGAGFAEDYYLCISHCTVLAVSLRHIIGDVVLSEVAGAQAGQAQSRIDFSGQPVVDRDDAVYDLSEMGEENVLCPGFLQLHARHSAETGEGDKLGGGCVTN